MYIVIYITYSRTLVRPDSRFSAPIIGKRDMPGYGK